MTLRFEGHVKVIQVRRYVQNECSDLNGFGEKTKKPKTQKPSFFRFLTKFPKLF